MVSLVEVVLNQETFFTDNRPDGPDGPDGPNPENVVYPGANIGDWERTSQILSIDIRINNGQVSIAHTKADQWNPTESVGSSSVEDPVEGNAWIFVPLADGKTYAAPYDWIGKADPDHMLDVETLDNFYKQLPVRAGVPELRNWVPLPGDKIGFMVSGLAKNGLKNVEERSNMLVVTLPDSEGKIPIEVCSQNEETTEGTNIPTCRDGCEVPNRITIIDNLANRHSDAMNKAHALNSDSGDVEGSDERWEFMDRVVETLRTTDDGFGYTCVNKDCENISTGKVAYKCKVETTENTTNSTANTTSGSTTSTVNNPLPDVSGDIITIDILRNGSGTQWTSSDPETDPQDGWAYPRPGAGDEDGTGEEKPELADEVGPGGGVSPPPSTSSTSSTPPTSSTECSDDSNTPESQLDLVKRIAAKTNNLYQTSPDQFTQNVAECLRAIDSKWGRHLNNNTLSNNIVAYNTEGSGVPYSIQVIANADSSNPTLVWNILKSDGQCGQAGGQWQKIEGNCIVELEGHCTEEQIDSGYYDTVDGKCYPECESFYESNALGVDIGTGDECDDENYNTLPIQNTLEEKQDSTKCCRRSSKTDCSVAGYRFIGDNCYPSCMTAASLAGHSSYEEYENDNAFIELITFTTSDCEDLSHDQTDDWTDFNFYDSYRFQSSTNLEGTSTCKLKDCPERTGCCIKKLVAPDTSKIIRYDSNGWSQSDRERVGSPSSSNTTPPPATPTPSGGGSRGNECTNETQCGHLECGGGEQTFEVFCNNGRCECGT